MPDAGFHRLAALEQPLLRLAHALGLAPVEDAGALNHPAAAAQVDQDGFHWRIEEDRRVLELLGQLGHLLRRGLAIDVAQQPANDGALAFDHPAQPLGLPGVGITPALAVQPRAVAGVALVIPPKNGRGDKWNFVP